MSVFGDTAYRMCQLNVDRMPMTGRELIQTFEKKLSPLYGNAEAQQIAWLVAGRVCGLERVDLVLKPDAEVVFGEGFSPDDLRRMIAELVGWRPVQYVLGEAWFAGRRFSVREGVLIPRPETEELVRWIADDLADKPSRILDLGTGSGCIAVSLAAELCGAAVTAVDIAPEALEIARENAATYAVQVDFRRIDILDPPAGWVAQAEENQFDAIVSNPPYIPESAHGAMRPNVTRHEPSGALFVPDDDPLRFYRAIARLGRRVLADGGSIYFEIFERLGGEVVRMLGEEGYGEVELRRDIFEKPRMVRCRKEN